MSGNKPVNKGKPVSKDKSADKENPAKRDRALDTARDIAMDVALESGMLIDDDEDLDIDEEEVIAVPKEILLISNNKTSFLSATIKHRLQQEGFEVLMAGFDMDEVSRIADKPNLFLLNFENSEEDDKQFLMYIRDLCVAEETKVYLCGYDHKIAEVAAMMLKETVAGSFKRPFDVNDLMAKINKEIDKYKLEQGKKHILVVDDSGEMLHAVRDWLSDTYRVSAVNSGANAILFLANQKPDLILLDYEMPFCSGPQMMEMIRAESSTSSIPIIFLTGKSDKESLMKVLSLKPEGYMLKSTKPEKIKESIANFFIDQKAREYNKKI